MRIIIDFSSKEDYNEGVEIPPLAARQRRQIMGKIVCVGSSNVDMTGYVPHLPVAGETVMGTALRIGPGGKGANQITAARRAGSEVVMISRIGDDALSDVLTNHFKQNDISTQYIKRIKGESTSTALIEIDSVTAQNRIVVLSSILQKLPAEEVREAEAEFADGNVVLVQYETSKESIFEARRLAKKYGKLFVVNPAPFSEMPADFYDGVDLITPNETEAGYLTGIEITDIESAFEAGKKLVSMGVGAAVITLGVNGALYTDGKTYTHVKGLRVKAVDTTGAGDAFNGGLITALADGLDIKTALCFANCTGALSVTKPGAGDAMPYRADILALMEQEYGIKA